MKKKTGRKMKLENKFGTICCLKGNRRRPYMARTGPIGENDVGDPIRKILGYYETYDDAYLALIEYNRNPFDIDARKVTFETAYKTALDLRRNSPKGLSYALERIYKTSFNMSVSLHKRTMCDIKTGDLQLLMDDFCNKYSYSSLNSLKSMWNMMWKYCVQAEICTRNCSELVEINKQKDIEHCESLSRADVDLLWEHADDEKAAMALVMCYSGFRASAFADLEVNLDERYFKGGIKTDSGRDRIVPIHERILPLVVRLKESRVLFGYPYQTIFRRFQVLSSEYGFKHTAHDCRATFATMLSRENVDENIIKRLMGHSLTGNVTQDVYISKTLDELRAEINKIP